MLYCSLVLTMQWAVVKLLDYSFSCNQYVGYHLNLRRVRSLAPPFVCKWSNLEVQAICNGDLISF